MDDDVIQESVFAKINRESDEARMARKALSVRADDNVWCSHVPWMECGSDSGGLRPTEDTVFAHYSHKHRWKFLAIKAKEHKEQNGTKESAYHPNHKLPLRDVMRQRGETIKWMDLGFDWMGKKHFRAVVVKLDMVKKKAKREKL